MNPWKEIVVTAHDLLDESAGTPAKKTPLVVRIASMLLELRHAHDHAQDVEGRLKLAEHQIERQSETIRKLQPKEPSSDVPPAPTVEEYNAKVVEEIKRQGTARRRKRLQQ